MKKTLGFHFGFSFIEANAQWADQLLQKRYFLSETSEKEAIEDFLGQLPINEFSQVNITTKWSERIIKQKIGSNIAFLVTEGFQNWPKIRQPAFNKRFQRQPRRKESVISDDLIFGLSERVSESGEVLRTPQTNEIEFLHSKFQLMGIKNIALGFLHSNKNAENELFVKNSFEKLGYKVLCSHESLDEENEVARWWRVVLDAYVVEVYEELRKTCCQAFADQGIQARFIDSSGNVFVDEEKHYFSSLFGKSSCLSRLYESEESVLYLGLEDFIYLEPGKWDPIYKSDFGPVGIPHVKQTRLEIQPTAIIESDEWKLFNFSKQELGFEPGPMILGKSLTPCFLDLLYANEQLDSFKSLNNMIRPNSKSRILESLYTFTRDTEYENRLEEFISLMRDVAYKKIATELLKQANLKSNILLTGPLAPVLFPKLKQLIGSRVKIDHDSEYVDASSTGVF